MGSSEHDKKQESAGDYRNFLKRTGTCRMGSNRESKKSVFLRGATLFAVLCLLSSCRCQLKDPTPEVPKDLSGWVGKDFQYVHAIGDHLLKVGESSDNGKIGIALLEIQPGQPCRDDPPHRPSSRQDRIYSKYS